MNLHNLQSALRQLHRDINPSSYTANAFSFTTPTHNVNSITTFPFEHAQCCNQQNSISQENETNLFHKKDLANDYFEPFDLSESANHPPTSRISPAISLCVGDGYEYQSNHQQQKQNQPHSEMKQKNQFLNTSNDAHTRPETKNQAKKRKKESRRIYQVPFVEKIATRSWRKYGSKPIKGSPYPRGYYRCSLAKDCPARKQVDMKRSNPDVLIITYIGEHNHPLPHSPCDEREKNQNTQIDEIQNVGDDNVLEEVIDEGMFQGLDEIAGLPQEDGFFKGHETGSTASPIA